MKQQDINEIKKYLKIIEYNTLYIKHYVENQCLSAEDDCDESLENIKLIIAKLNQQQSDGCEGCLMGDDLEQCNECYTKVRTNNYYKPQ